MQLSNSGFWDAAVRAASFVPLATRLVIGQAFFLTGRGKWMHMDSTVAYFAQIGIPFPEANAAMMATLELVGGFCLIVGLGTRLFALLLSAAMVVALLTAERDNFLEALGSDLTGITPLIFLLFLVWLVKAGPGAVSADAAIERRLFGQRSIN